MIYDLLINIKLNFSRNVFHEDYNLETCISFYYLVKYYYDTIMIDFLVNVFPL